MPATVQAVLAARIDRLAPEDKRLLQAAAVIGKDVPYALLQAIAELPEDALRQGLARLQAAEFLYETSLFPDLEYTFKHALTHEVAYGSLLQERRRALHARIVDGHRGAVPRPPGRAGRAARPPRAAGRGVGQGGGLPAPGRGEGGGALGAPRGGGATSSRRSTALGHLPDEPRDPRAGDRPPPRPAQLALSARRASSGSRATCSEAEALAAALDDQRRLGWVAVYLAQLFLGDWATTSAPSRPASARSRIATALGDLALQVEAQLPLGQAYYALGRLSRGDRAAARANVAVAGRRPALRALRPAVPARRWLARPG